MSRDFLINFENKSDAKSAEKILLSYVDLDNMDKVFNVDNRGNSLFVEVIYSNNIDDDTAFFSKVRN